MVSGIEKFKEFFKDFTDNYIIIGGTACDIIIENAGFEPRATNDIDLIIMIEALSPEFVTQFWKLRKISKLSNQRKEMVEYLKEIDFKKKHKKTRFHHQHLGLGEEVSGTAMQI